MTLCDLLRLITVDRCDGCLVIIHQFMSVQLLYCERFVRSRYLSFYVQWGAKVTSQLMFNNTNPVCRIISNSANRYVRALGWVHTCNVTAYRNTLSWQCGRDSWPRNVSKGGYAVTLRASSARCRYLAVASKGCYGYGRSRCGRATWRCKSTPAPAVTVSSPLMRRSNTDSAPKKPVTLPRNQLLIRYACASPVHTVTIRCYDTR
jgi:hypothetical protein